MVSCLSPVTVWGVGVRGFDGRGGQPHGGRQGRPGHRGVESHLLDNQRRSHAELRDPNQSGQQRGNAVCRQGNVQETFKCLLYITLDNIMTPLLPPPSFPLLSPWTTRPRRSTRYSSRWRTRSRWFPTWATAPAPRPPSTSPSWTSTRAPCSSPTPWSSPGWRTSPWAASWPRSTPPIRTYCRYRASGKRPRETNWNREKLWESEMRGKQERACLCSCDWTSSAVAGGAGLSVMSFLIFAFSAALFGWAVLSFSVLLCGRRLCYSRCRMIPATCQRMEF